MQNKFLEKPLLSEEKIFDCLVIGSGAAGFNCAVHLFDKGVKNLAVITENRLAGTSRNTGSDKQTYYKMSYSGAQNDSPFSMAQTLFDGASMDGDTALCEAAGSLQEFFHLASIGVDFPHNEYGEFVGYKTDFDPACRASSIGPYTSKAMTERLEKETQKREIPIIDKSRAVKLLIDKKENRAYGLLCFENGAFKVYFSKNIVFAIGGPSGLYRDTIYPRLNFGSNGILAREGIVFSNIMEWQYGIGSCKFPWALSGGYQQVIPRYVSIDANGKEEEFLCSYFSSIKSLGKAVFLKGYQWPFDPNKLADEGSSILDIAVYIERYVKGKKVYLDYMHNPSGNEKIGQWDLTALDKTAYDYLSASNALEKTPIQRLLKMNPQAYNLFKTHNIDLAKEYLEISVLPQHNNGGAQVDCWWQTSINHLFAIGECAGTHGVHRPGGSALNSGQVGGFRAAQFIARNYAKDDFYSIDGIKSKTEENIKEFEKEFDNTQRGGASNSLDILYKLQDNNSRFSSFLRPSKNIKEALSSLENISKEKILYTDAEIVRLFQIKEMLLMSRLLNETILYYAQQGGKSRGSYIILSSIDDIEAIKNGIETDKAFSDKILNSQISNNKTIISARFVRPIPNSNQWFETVWKQYQEKQL
ncbi:MAG: FAD-binding protein [Elusimicrobiota bacterium]|jgi:succinate dehydrogenase/fumarate reductase flavoprotein subunit|nr:FAD-binding protein [Elusimicrobiota bacterium]